MFNNNFSVSIYVIKLLHPVSFLLLSYIIIWFFLLPMKKFWTVMLTNMMSIYSWYIYLEIETCAQKCDMHIYFRLLTEPTYLSLILYCLSASCPSLSVRVLGQGSLEWPLDLEIVAN